MSNKSNEQRRASDDRVYALAHVNKEIFSDMVKSAKRPKDVTDKLRENRLRRKANRQELILRKSRRRDTDALGYGLYMLSNHRDMPIHAGDPTNRTFYTLDLDDVEVLLTDTD